MDVELSSASTDEVEVEVVNTLRNWTYKPKPGAKNNTCPETDDYNEWYVEHLRKECTARGFHLERSVSKEDRIKRLMAQDEMRDKLMEQNIQDDSLLTPEVVGTVRMRHCLFRLLNLLFRNKHITKFMTLSDALGRCELDTRRAGLDSRTLFWNSVREDFIDETSIEYDLLMTDDHVAFEDIDPSMIVPHSVVKLEDMWKEVNRQYKKAKINYTRSGTAESDFWNFCDGHSDVMYLWSLLQTRQEATSFVDGGMLEEDCFDSMGDNQTLTTPVRTRKCVDVTEDQLSSSSRGSYRKQQKLIEEEKRDELLATIKTLAKVTQTETFEYPQSQDRVNRLDIERGLMASLDQVMESLDRMKQRLKYKTEADEIDELKDTIEYYKSKRTSIKAELRRLI